jgi:origin recognition complex subunit 1
LERLNPKPFLRRTVEVLATYKPRRVAKINDVHDVIKAMQNSPTAAFVGDCTLHEKIMLAALLKCVRSQGVEEIKWGDVSNIIIFLRH